MGKKDLESLMTTENLRGLTSIFTDLSLVRDQGGKPVFNTESGPLTEVLSRIENRTSYGEVATGRYLIDEFAKEPFGWDFDVVRLFVIALLRAGKLEATSKGQIIESALSLDARNTFANNNLFRQASFRPKVGLEFTNIVDASEYFKEVFGREISGAGTRRGRECHPRGRSMSTTRSSARCTPPWCSMVCPVRKSCEPPSTRCDPSAPARKTTPS